MLMKPGIYYTQTKGFSCAANCNITTITGFVDGAGGTNTGWDGTKAGGGVMVYNVTGPINIGSNGSAYMIGSPAASAYKGILFFEAGMHRQTYPPRLRMRIRSAAVVHMTLIGTLVFYEHIWPQPLRPQPITRSFESREIREAQPRLRARLLRTPLTLGGGGSIVMNLNPAATLIVPQVALVQ